MGKKKIPSELRLLRVLLKNPSASKSFLRYVSFCCVKQAKQAFQTQKKIGVKCSPLSPQKIFHHGVNPVTFVSTKFVSFFDK